MTEPYVVDDPIFPGCTFVADIEATVPAGETDLSMVYCAKPISWDCRATDDRIFHICDEHISFVTATLKHFTKMITPAGLTS